MRLILSGLALMLASLALLMAMVVPLLAPSLALSLLAYAGCFSGLLLALGGAVERQRRLRG